MPRKKYSFFNKKKNDQNMFLKEFTISYCNKKNNTFICDNNE